MSKTKILNQLFKIHSGLGIVAQTCNPNYLGRRDRKIRLVNQPRKKSPRPQPQVWRHTSVMPAIQEAEVA
jgi:hypothetical protein